MKKNIFLITIIVVILTVAVTLYYFVITENINNTDQPSVPNIREATQLDNKTVSWNTYQNEEYGFKIKYPSDWEIRKTANEFAIKSPGGDINPVLHISFVDEEYSTILATEQDKFNKWQKQIIEEPSGKINDIVMSGNPAKEFLYFSPVGFVEQIIIMSKNGQTVRINSFKDSILDPVLATFELTK